MLTIQDDALIIQSQHQAARSTIPLDSQPLGSATPESAPQSTETLEFQISFRNATVTVTNWDQESCKPGSLIHQVDGLLLEHSIPEHSADSAGAAFRNPIHDTKEGDMYATHPLATSKWPVDNTELSSDDAAAPVIEGKTTSIPSWAAVATFLFMLILASVITAVCFWVVVLRKSRFSFLPPWRAGGGETGIYSSDIYLAHSETGRLRFSHVHEPLEIQKVPEAVKAICLPTVRISLLL